MQHATTGDKSGLKKQEEIKVCQCGSREPAFRGYCRDCLTKLKATFDRYLERFRLIQEEYDQYTSLDQKSADEKLRLMRKKIEQYEVRLADQDLVDVLDKHSKLS